MDIISRQEAKSIFLAYLANNKNSQEQGTKLEKFIVRFQDWIPLLRGLNIKTWRNFAYESHLSAKDTGIDLMGDNGDGLYPIQAKNYVGRNEIHRKELDAFCNNIRNLDIPEKQIKNAYLFFNGSLTKDATDLINNTNASLRRESKDWQIKENDLDEIFPALYDQLSTDEPEQLASLKKFKEFLKNNRPEHKKIKELRGYQQRALAKATEHYLEQKNERGLMIMACGTGKTLTSLAITKKITPSNGLILFLVPTLDLKRQTIKVARIDTNFNFEGFAVCSDKTTIYDDENTVSEAELPINEVFRDEGKMINFYQEYKARKSDNRLIVFCTYQSVDKIVEAQTKGFPQFDLVVCDEAHRTVGIQDQKTSQKASNFLVVHDNQKLRSHQRLYMTATPKLFTDSKKIKGVYEDVTLWDMNNPATFGKEFFTYSFAEGVEDNYLSDFQVIVLGLLEDEFYEAYYEAKQRFDESKRGKDFIEVGDYTNLIGIHKIIDEYKIKKAISFCSRAKKGKRNSLSITEFFKSEVKKIHSELNDTSITDVKMEHIDGTMISSRRKEILSKFDENNKSCLIVSNARCLSEGIDVPALDAVIFLHPRKSQVDIVQAVGRVMRISQNKRVGRVIIPVIGRLKTDKNKKIKIDLDKTSFKAVTEILNALRSDKVKSTITGQINNVRELDDIWPERDIEVRVSIDASKLAKAILRRRGQIGQQNYATSSGGG